MVFHITLYFIAVQYTMSFICHIFPFLACTTVPKTELPPMNNSAIRCHLLTSCTEVQCCVKADNVNRTFEAKLNLDPCQQRMTVVLERLEVTMDLLSYQWGTREQYHLYGVMRLDFTVHNLVIDDSYLVTMDLSLCFESNNSCEVVQNIFTDYKLRRKACDWSSGYTNVNPSFSLENWMTGRNENPVVIPVPANTQAELLQYLKIAQYVKNSTMSCDPATDAIYQGVPTNGFYKGTDYKFYIPYNGYILRLEIFVIWAQKRSILNFAFLIFAIPFNRKND